MCCPSINFCKYILVKGWDLATGHGLDQEFVKWGGLPRNLNFVLLVCNLYFWLGS